MRKSTSLPLLLILIVAALWAPAIAVQPPIASGDHGRDLYAFQMTAQGGSIYKDFWWQYGPIMPLYYACWFKLGGINLIMARLGLGVIYLTMVLLAYGSLRNFTSPIISAMAALAFLSFDMMWTFNHIGGVPFLLLAIGALWKFFLTRKVRWCYVGCAGVTGIALVKLSIGITSFVAFLACLAMDRFLNPSKDEKHASALRHLFVLACLFSTVVAGTYLFLFRGLSLDWIGQCLTVGPQYRDWGSSPLSNFEHLLMRVFVWERWRLLWIGVFTALGMLAYLGLKKQNAPENQANAFRFAVGSLAIFGVFNAMEYFVQEGLIYRLDFWIFPIAVLLAGLCGEYTKQLLPKPMKVGLGILIFTGILWIPAGNLKQALAWRVPERFWHIPRGRVYYGGHGTDPQVILEATKYLLKHTDPSEPILCLPYDPLYCFLTDRRHAVRELLFMEHINITEGQEKNIIRNLKSSRVPLVLISNRIHSKEGGNGIFGKTHCRLLGDYITANYEQAAGFGPWDANPLEQHAVRILKRRE